MKRRILSIITALALCLSLCPTWALAAEADPFLCKHHPEHTEDCGYTAPTEGHDCGHRHTAECYTKGVLPDADGGDYYEIGADTENLLDCQHSHDSACGYVEADPGAPCGYVCRICPIEDLIAALPEQVTEDNADDVRAQLDEILALYRELDEGEQGQLDLSRCYELQEALDNANAPVQAAEEITINNATVKTLTAEDGDCPGHTFTGTARRTMIYVASGVHNVTFSNLSITGTANVGIAPGATMNLTIEGTNTIQADYNLAGIYVPVGATLAIQGAGSLDVSGDNSAGIGGAAYAPDESGSDGDPNCGTVEINGGTITATGGSRCAGIGGGTTDYVPGNGGTVTINDGTVTAKGGSDNYYGGAGIGGAGGVSNEWNKLVSGNGGTLTINGGTVNLTAGTHNPQYPAYGFGQGTGSAPGGTCELTLADESYLTLAEGTTLDPKGKYTINGDPTADMIVVPELVYTGEVLDTSGIKIDDSKTGTGTYFGQTFTVNASADGWTYAINPSEVKAAGDYTVTFSKEGHTSISKTFTVAKSGTQFVGDGEVKTYNGSEETTSFSAGDTITVKATPTATGTAPQKAAARLRGGPSAGQMALYVGDMLVSSEAANADADGTYTMTVSASDVLTLGGVEPNGDPITLTAKFEENDNMADAAGTVEVSISAVAKAEKGGAVIGYYGESGLVAALANSGNEGAVFTLLDNMERETDLKINISCTLDLNGKTIRSKGEYVPTLSTYYGTAVTIRGEGTVISEQGHGFSVGGTTTLEGGTFISGAANCGGVYVQAGKLIVTGEAVVIENTGGGTGLGVGYNAEAQLSGGTYSSIWVDSPHTLAGLLNQEGASRVAYYKDNTTLVTEGLDGKELTGTVTVKACTHTGEGVCTYTHNENTSTHTKTCLACGKTWDAEDCAYTFSGGTGTCAACGDSVTVTVSGTDGLIYDGTEKEPGVTVMRGETALTAGTDYTVAYTDNKNAGENKATVAVTIGNGQGNYIQNFTIGRAAPTITWSSTSQELTYTSQQAVITAPTVTLVNNESFGGTIHYSYTGTTSGTGLPTNAGTYTIMASITAEGNYTNAQTATPLALTINKADQAPPAAPAATEENIKDTSITLTTIANAEYSMDGTTWQASPAFTGLNPNQTYTFYARLKEDDNHNASPNSPGESITTRRMMLGNATVTVGGSYTYTGAAQTPAVAVVKNGKTLTAGTDYTVSYANNTNAGTATVTITGMGDYEGTNSTTFTIQRKTLTVAGAIAAGRPYNGTNTVTITGVTLDGIVGSDEVSVDTANLTGTLNGSNVGSYAAVTLPALTLTGGGADNYTLTRPAGAVSTSVTISKAAARTPKTGDLAVANKQAHTYTFGLGALRPDLPAGMSFGSSAVTYTLDAVSLGSYYDSSANSAKIEGQTLTLPIQAVESNKAEGIGTITVTIHTGNFEDMTATINVRSVNKTIPTGAPTLSAATLTYGQPLSTITLRGDMAAGATPVPGKFEWSSPDNRPAVQEAYAAAWVFTPTDNNTYAIVNGTSTIKVVPASVAGAVVTLSPTSFRYDGQSHSPTVTSVKLGDTTLTADTDYTVEIPTETAAGTYTVTITGKGNYTGTAAATFTINPVETSDEFEDESGTTLRLEVETGLSTVPEALKNNAKYDTPAKIEAELRTQVEQVMSNVGENIAVFDVTLQYKDESGTWHTVDPNDFPTEGVTAILPYPDGTGATGYTFTVQHLISSGAQAGTMETLSYTLTADGLQCKFSSLSPVAIGYQAAAKPVDPVHPNPGGNSGGGGGGVSTYAVTVEKSEHGKVTANRTNASNGSTVTLTVTPDTGYVLDTLTVTDSRGNAIKLTAQGGGKYTFTMPGRAVTVRAAFAPLPDGTACDGGEGCPSRSFTDLGSVGTWYHEAVDYVLQNNLMGGYGNGTFGPNDTLTRAQFAQILYNKEGRPAVTGGGIFTDVAPGAWCAPAITWAAERSIVGGYGNGMFGPNDNITREQLAVMLWRYAGSPAATDKELHFNDADKASGYALDALRWAVENGIINGKGGGILDPKGLATRAQTAQMLKNFIESQEDNA